MVPTPGCESFYGTLFLIAKQFYLASRRCLKMLAGLLCALILVLESQAQFTETIFYDTLSKVSNVGDITGGYGEGKYIYLTGSSFSRAMPVPSVTKLDTGGNVIWTATDQDLTGLLGKVPNMEKENGWTTHLVKDGHRIFTACRNRRLWCIDDSGGTLIWNIEVPGGRVLKIVNYSSSELLVLTGYIGMQYLVIDKETGRINFSRQLFTNNYAHSAELMVDSNRNILINWGDVCYKYRDRELTQLVWQSTFPFYLSASVTRVLQDSTRYILAGLNNVSAFDSLTGDLLWYTPVSVGYVPGVQSGTSCYPKQIIVRDSMIYIIWVSPVVGGLEFKRAFTLTCVNKNNGHLRYNVAYDFDGVPPDPPPGVVQDELDWPMAFCLDASGNAYLTGSYDQSIGPESPGNWGIMKINGATGEKMYEATITADSLHRCQASQGLFIEFKYGKLYVAGNLAKTYTTVNDTKPVLISFDSGTVYHERFRITPWYTLRYPSLLKGMEPVGRTKMALLKMVGRSATVELRSGYNQLLWSRSFSSSTKFMVPTMLCNVHDTAIAASFLLYKEEPVIRLMPGVPDSLVFVCFDTLGNLKYRRQLPHITTDSIAPEPVQVYTDAYDNTNFIYRRWIFNNYFSRYFPFYVSYMPGGSAKSWGGLNGNPVSEEQLQVPIRRSVVSHYSADTMALFFSLPGLRSQGHFCSARQSPSSGYAGYYLKTVRRFKMIYSSMTVDSGTQVIFGRDSSDQMLAARYNFHQRDPVIWNTVSSTGSYYAADTSATSIYAVGRQRPDDALMVSKMERLTGASIWDFSRTPTSQTSLIPLDFRYDRVNSQFTVGGRQLDSSFGQVRSSYFYITLDSNGTIIKDVTRAGDLLGYTQASVINSLQSGSHFYGGQLATSLWGVVGFYNTDCFGNIFTPSVGISTPSSTVCSGAAVTFTAHPLAGGVQPQYQWMVNGINLGNGTDTFVTRALKNNDQVSVRLTSNAGCLQTNTATSNIIHVTVASRRYPTIQLSGKVTVYPGSSTLIGTTVANLDSTAVYQWQDSTESHGWLDIPAAGLTTLMYRPMASGDKLRCLLKTNSVCAPNYTTPSNVLSFILDASTAVSPEPAIYRGIRYYPNPVRNFLIIDSLNAADGWQTMEILSISGRPVQTVPATTATNKIYIQVGYLEQGVYIGILRSIRRNPVYLKFVKL